MLILCLDLFQRDFETFKLSPLLFAGFLGVLDRLLQRSYFRDASALRGSDLFLA